MAEIPVRKTGGGIPWWVWLLLLLLVGGLLFWLFGTDRRDASAVPATAVESSATENGAAMATGDMTATTGRNAPNNGTITDLTTITGASGTSLVGRDVRLSRVKAGDVPYDAGFWIDGAAGTRVWVVLKEVLTPNTPIEGRVDVDKGDTIDVTGTIRDAADGSPPNAAIPGPTKPIPSGVTQYIYASEVLQSK